MEDESYLEFEKDYKSYKTCHSFVDKYIKDGYKVDYMSIDGSTVTGFHMVVYFYK